MKEREQRTLRQSTLIASTIALVVAGTVVLAKAQIPTGCDTAVGPITESNQFTPYDGRLSHLPDVHLTFEGQAVTSSDKRVNDLPLRWIAGDGERSLYQYFFEREFDPKLTLPAFLADGGIQLDRESADGDPFTAADVVAQVGERAVEVRIGDSEGALVWADPESNGVRPHHVYWSDGTFNYILIAVREPERMVQLARGIVCGG
jgi:hypothetical protein